MEALISKEDIQDYREIAETIADIETLEPYIIEAQNIELRGFLGDAMFYDLMNDIDSDKYQTLLDGESYTTSAGDTINFDGLKPYLCYIAYARLLLTHGLKVTRFGIVQKQSEHSEPANDAAIERMITKARANARFYLTQIKKYLDEKRTTYTLWGANQSYSKMSSPIIVTQITNE